MRQTAIKIVKILQDAGHQAVFAGGCVRDQLLGIEPKDIDIATSATPDQVEALFDRTVPDRQGPGRYREEPQKESAYSPHRIQGNR